MTANPETPLIAIVGPTASGKSALGVFLARELGGEVVVCDSTQMYRGFEIGTAKPTMAERGGVPHHLLDVLELEEENTAGGYRERALKVLEDLRARQKHPVFTVGTGLYLRVLLEGLAEVPVRSEALRDRLRARVVERPPGYLHRILRRLDPKAAEKIQAADTQKLIRAVEVCLLTRKPLTEIYQSGRKPLEGWRAIKLGLMGEREALYARVHARTDAMLAQGWLEETRQWIAGGVAEGSKVYDFIGYRDLKAALEGTQTLDQARAAIQQATRRYAKRQLTWFRREEGVHWFSGFGDQREIQQAALAWVRGRLDGASLDETGKAV